MQQHTGSILFRLVHAAYGYDNVGFHLGREIVTMDFNGTIPAEDVPELERRANGGSVCQSAGAGNVPSRGRAENAEYRSKLELEKDVRIVIHSPVWMCAPAVRLT